MARRRSVWFVAGGLAAVVLLATAGLAFVTHHGSEQRSRTNDLVVRETAATGLYHDIRESALTEAGAAAGYFLLREPDFIDNFNEAAAVADAAFAELRADAAQHKPGDVARIDGLERRHSALVTTYRRLLGMLGGPAEGDVLTIVVEQDLAAQVTALVDDLGLAIDRANAGLLAAQRADTAAQRTWDRISWGIAAGWALTIVAAAFATYRWVLRPIEAERAAYLQRALDLQRASHEESVMLLAAAAELHDETTGLHLQHVREMAEALALELGYTPDGAREIGLAAVLHDIGKIRVPRPILTTPGRLDDGQRALMRRHAVWGHEFLAARPGFELAAQVARAHHEHWDGSGYPDGLAGDAIPEAAQIASVADAFDAIVADRPYSAARPPGDALREIVACRGTQFSPRVVDALERVCRRTYGTAAAARVRVAA